MPLHVLPREGVLRTPEPFAFLIKDRADGKTWYLLFDDTSKERVKISDVLPAANLARIYDAYHGPYVRLADRAVRLLIRGGRIGFEYVPFRASSSTIFIAKLIRTSGNFILSGGNKLFQLEFVDDPSGSDSLKFSEVST